jgi:CXXX repeat modification system protein
MEQHQLGKKEYADLHKIVAEKRAVKEMLESLKAQLSASIIQEDRWWQKMAKKYNLDTAGNVYSINHASQEIVGIPRPQRNTPEQSQQAVQQPQQQAQDGVRVRERTPEMNKLVSSEELEAMRQAREAINNDN